MLINMTRTLQSTLTRLPNPGDAVPAMSKAFHELGDFGAEPSMVFAGPKFRARRIVDEGRSVELPAPVAFWLKRDDYPPDCDPAIAEGGAVYTYMLPEDY